MNVRKINSLKDNQCIECCFLWRDIKSLVVFIHNSLEDIGFHHILQEIDFDALPDGDEFEAFLGEWLKQFSPEIPVSFRLFPEAVSLQGASYAPPFFSLLTFSSGFKHSKLKLFFHLICAPVSLDSHRFLLLINPSIHKKSVERWKKK